MIRNTRCVICDKHWITREEVACEWCLGRAERRRKAQAAIKATEAKIKAKQPRQYDGHGHAG